MKIRLLAAVCCTAAALHAANAAEERLQSATNVFKEVMGIREKSIPQDLLNKAACIVIVPDLKKAAFLVGGKYGKGFIMCRREGGVGWSAPGAVRVEGGGIGFQIGASEMDILMLVM